MRPGLDTRYRVRQQFLLHTRELLLPSARAQVEGTVVWWGRMVSPALAEVIHVYRPRQIAHRSPYGLSVEVPQDAISDMIVALPPGVFVAARLHTHGTHAYHSELDDTNMLVAHEGAISIVIPHFAREPIELLRCSVNVLDHERGWLELTPEAVARRFEVIDG